MDMDQKKPSILEYTDYRLFLKDRYDFLKQTTTYFSFRYFSKKAGFKSPNYLKLVIEGDRNISEDSIDRFALAFKLNKAEHEFFGYLVGYCQASNNVEKSEFALKLLQTKIYQKINPLTQDRLNYYQKWFQIGVRELALCKGAIADPAWIAKQFRPALTVKEASLAVDSLIRLGMLKKDKKGRLTASEQNVQFQKGVISSIVAVYHKRMLDKAKESLDISTKDERDISSVCVPISEKTFNEMRERIRTFRQELIALASNDDDPDQVYQLNLQLFPLTNKVEP